MSLKYQPSSTLKQRVLSSAGDRVLDVCEKDVNALKALYRRAQAFVAQAKVPKKMHEKRIEVKPFRQWSLLHSMSLTSDIKEFV